jgi:pilus assembly protein TadC
MQPPRATPSSAEVANEVNNQLVGLTLLTFALFPLSLPVLVLVAASLLPFAVAGLLAVGIFVLPLRLARVVRRGWSRRRRYAPALPDAAAASRNACA